MIHVTQLNHHCMTTEKLCLMKQIYLFI